MRPAKAQLDSLDFPVEESSYSFTDPRTALKQEVSERLAAHRSRKGRNPEGNLIAMAEPRSAAAKPAKARSTRIAAAVAERYAHSQTYRDFLASEAERAIEEAHATAEVAVRTAEAVTAVQQQLLAELDLWPAPAAEDSAAGDHLQETGGLTHGHRNAESVASSVHSAANPVVHSVAPGLTVRLYEDVGLRQPDLRPSNRPRMGLDRAEGEALDEEHYVLDEEIDFRRAPVFEAPATQATPIPANLIAFPRQLIASRKSRPRLAEGPLRDEVEAAATTQLRIFEVEANQISSAASPGVESALPEWSSIRLDAAPASVSEVAQPANLADHVGMQMYVPLHTAPLSQRLMSASVDACILGVAFLAAVCAFAFAVNQIPTGTTAVIAAAATLLVLSAAYHLLFFTFSDATPGMRYARIGLCTFGDENPTRSEMRRRTLAILFAACPLGLGLAWALLDEDGLGWHDRLSRMYQRSY